MCFRFLFPEKQMYIYILQVEEGKNMMCSRANIKMTILSFVNPKTYKLKWFIKLAFTIAFFTITNFTVIYYAFLSRFLLISIKI